MQCAIRLGAGIYGDEVRKTPSGWRFQSRRYELSAPLEDLYFT